MMRLRNLILLSSEQLWISSGRSGYVQTVDYDKLVRTATQAGAVLHVRVRPGHFVLQAGAHVGVHATEALEAA